MRALADFIMRGRTQAILVVAGGALLPMLFWLSAAAGSLVLLRRGLSDALGILVWALLPAIGWWWFGEPRTLLVVVGALALALVLRTTVSWVKVLLASVLVGVVFGLVLGSLFAEPIQAVAAELHKLMPQFMGSGWEQLSADEQAQVLGLVVPVLTGLMASLLQIVTLLCLVLGRYWQASLYNPGGFGEEFRALRLPVLPALLLVAGMLLGPSLGLPMLAPLCSVPLVFAGVALVHGLVAAKRLARFWLVGLYVTLVLFMQLVYPLLMVLAIVDSLFDFRGRATRKGSGPANGEG
ncbi:MAG TPA: hypothetical protein VL129_05755 [Pseudomonas sp.]|uniref:hypothetical protein n=1 Tax=Pseudomonas sp. TaxID=306 RepID=UPI002C9F3D5E|nr:hypothetical protein [Pseudomonas sp.]HTO18637.1 hypothetical protein [Pseudomonas sp.]